MGLLRQVDELAWRQQPLEDRLAHALVNSRARCGGQLSVEPATIPFVLGKSMAVIKQVPAEVCDTCGESFLHAEATDVVSLPSTRCSRRALTCR